MGTAQSRGGGQGCQVGLFEAKFDKFGHLDIFLLQSYTAVKNGVLAIIMARVKPIPLRKNCHKDFFIQFLPTIIIQPDSNSGKKSSVYTIQIWVLSKIARFLLNIYLTGHHPPEKRVVPTCLMYFLRTSFLMDLCLLDKTFMGFLKLLGTYGCSR